METKTIVTPFGKVEVVLKEWLSKGEKISVERPFKNLTMAVDSSGIGKGELDAGAAQEKSIKIATECVVISVAGKTGNVYEQILAMRDCDGQFVLDEVDKIVKGEDFTKADAKPAAGIASAN
jgi:hypothetical protein